MTFRQFFHSKEETQALEISKMPSRDEMLLIKLTVSCCCCCKIEKVVTTKDFGRVVMLCHHSLNIPTKFIHSFGAYCCYYFYFYFICILWRNKQISVMLNVWRKNLFKRLLSLIHFITWRKKIFIVLCLVISLSSSSSSNILTHYYVGLKKEEKKIWKINRQHTN